MTRHTSDTLLSRLQRNQLSYWQCLTLINKRFNIKTTSELCTHRLPVYFSTCLTAVLAASSKPEAIIIGRSLSLRIFRASSTLNPKKATRKCKQTYDAVRVKCSSQVSREMWIQHIACHLINIHWSQTFQSLNYDSSLYKIKHKFPISTLIRQHPVFRINLIEKRLEWQQPESHRVGYGPSSLTTRGNVKFRALAALTIPLATVAQLTIPPNMFTSTALTCQHKYSKSMYGFGTRKAQTTCQEVKHQVFDKPGLYMSVYDTNW